MSKISGQFLISGQFQDICEISGISGQLGALHSIGMILGRGCVSRVCTVTHDNWFHWKV